MPDTPESSAAPGEQSVIGNLADLQEGQVALSRFIAKRDDGVFAIPANIGSAADFFAFADRIFAANALFRDLDYPAFLALLYDASEAGAAARPEIRFAADIVGFKPERQALYKPGRIENGEAVYLFEPLFVESTVDKPVVGKLEGGDTGVTGYEPATVSERAQLDFDEFVAALWRQGVRYGIEVAAVRAGIQREHAERLVVARPRPFKPGKDAEIKEQTADLRRDNAPRAMAGGKVDLNQFRNRYPQVKAGTRLLKKIPRVPGVDGRDIAGQPIAPPPLKDLDLASLAGPGVRAVPEPDGECLVAEVGGFLNIDTATNQFSITDKIIGREGVSVRTTGNLTLTGEEYEEYGEIQEKRVVECRSITAHADVFGTILSHGGLIRLKHNLSGGSATNEEGDILVEGLASGATLIAHQGTVSLKRAENCVVIGRHVIVERATCCDIVADSVQIDTAEGCAVAGKSLRIGVSRSRAQTDTVLSELIPDLSAHDRQLEAVRKKLAETGQALADQRARNETLRNQPEVRNYLVIAGKLQRKEMTLTAEQQAAFQKLATQAAPILRALTKIKEAAVELEARSAELAQEIETRSAARHAACAGIGCWVERIEGETQIRTLALKADAAPLASLPVKELRSRLRATDAATQRLFAGSGGNFASEYTAPA